LKLTGANALSIIRRGDACRSPVQSPVLAFGRDGICAKGLGNSGQIAKGNNLGNDYC
jgi:hypothetical protein